MKLLRLSIYELSCASSYLKYFLPFLVLSICFTSLGQGSRILAPNYPGTAALDAPAGIPSADNDDFAWLEHDSDISGNFLDPGAPANERLYIHIRDGETLYWGLRRIPVRYQVGVAYSTATIEHTNHEDLTVIVRENDGTLAQTTTLANNAGSTAGATLTSANGVIETVAESLLGPEFVFNTVTYNSGGYSPVSYTNNTGTDQEFYIEFLQDDGATTDINERSWYDLWDFTVYDDNEEKTGRLFCQRWGLTAQYFQNRLADEFQMFVRVPSTIGGVDAGNYIKELDIGGLDPFSLIVYANSEGSDGTGGDTNGDGTTDFQDHRQGQLTDIGVEEYDLFLQNPDIDVWPTTTLPSVTISDAVFFCNEAGTGGEASITIESNQVGLVGVLLDLDGVGGYQAGAEDVIVEAEIATEGSVTIRWDGIDGLGSQVASGTPITISGRFTSGPIHVPMFDAEDNPDGINMMDVRPSTSFDLIYWDDSYLVAQGQNTGANPSSELDGTNVNTHVWDDDGQNGGESNLLNTWSFGYYQVNTQNVNFTFACDDDGDGIVGTADLDSDNDGVTNSVEGDHQADADADNIPNYLDADFAGFTDSNGDGVDDNFDTDLDGIPDALDVDSDNDGIPDLIENGLTDSDNDGTLNEGSGITDTNINGLDDVRDAACDGITLTNFTGNATAVTSVSGLSTAFGANTDGSGAIGAPEGLVGGATLAVFGDVSAEAIYDMADLIPSGETLVVSFATNTAGNTFSIEGSPDNGTYTNLQTFSNTVDVTVETFNYVLTSDARFFKVIMTINIGGEAGIDGFAYNFNTTCSGGTALTTIDTDSDGVNNSLDLDSDNDGIVDVIEAGGSADASTGQIASFTDTNRNGFNDTQESVALTLPDTDADGSFADIHDIDSDNDGILDNIESQDSQSSIATVAGDTDGDGLLDAYDPNNGGTLLMPVDTDSDGTEDYLDTDSDGDGVEDFIEGWDNDRNGFSDLEILTVDNDLSNEAGHNVDSDTDGLWDIFEGSTAPTQNSDGSGKADWQDTDDDNDGILTSGEDVNSNSDWTDDKTQGQGGGATIPDYLFRGDYDGDAIADASDLDSDNDGILDSDEDNGETIDPSGDEDGDGIANYYDASDATVTTGLSATTDANSDGVYDVYDTDLDGVPDFLDLDADNDGVWDGVEANQGSVPFGMDETDGQFALQDPDNDGLMNYVDDTDGAAGGVSELVNPDTDSDGISDYLDIDSDDDGITDIIESQTTAALIALANNDTDGDGIDDAFDPNNGGVLIMPVNTDGVDQQDYRDTDSDNDGIRDIIEGDDTDEDGFGDWDILTQDNNETNETNWGTDTDGDGLQDIFDTVVLGAAGNATGSNVDLQNTDGIDFKNWRDVDDDNDGNLTEDEDINSNGNFADDLNDDLTGNVPDFLFFADFDGDLIADGSDADSDGDGIADVNEDGGEGVDPSADADGDGIPNYKDIATDPGLSSTADINGDGVYDVFDADLDGIPDFRDRDSDNDGIPDLVEVGGTDSDSDGEVDGNVDTDGDGIPDAVDVTQTGGADVDSDGIDDAFDFSVAGGTDTDGDDIIDGADIDRDGDGILNTYDVDPDNNAVSTSTLTSLDSDGDGLEDAYDLDSDNDGIPDLIEAGGTDADGDGKLDDSTDTDMDGFPDLIDSDNGGTGLTLPDSDLDGVRDYLDVDSDNDGITDTVENGGLDTNNDGAIDGFANDTDGDGLSDDVDPDNSGTPIANVDTDGDGIDDYLDLDVDNDGYPDILEAGGTDSDDDGIVNNTLNSDGVSDGDTVPDNVDVDSSGTNGGSGIDADGDEIDNTFDVDITGGSDTDGDGIDDAFDTDANGDGYDDAVEAAPYGQEDKEGDGKKDFRDMDSDGDGIPDVEEFGETINVANAQISGFTDANSNGWNDAQEATPLTLPNTDGDSFEDYRDIDADNDGIPDNLEGQTLSTYIAISDSDTDSDGLDDAYDPDNGGSIVSPPNTDATGDDDYLDTDSDGDTVNDSVEGDNDDKNQYADWDANTNGTFDDAGFNADTDSDGLLDIFDNNSSGTSANVTGSNSNGQDSDLDGIWDFQDTDDDGDGLLTSSQGGGNEDSDSNGDSTDDFDDDSNNIIPNYLYGDDDSDNDGVSGNLDADSDNDGLVDTSEDGGTGIDPSGDIDGDGILNYQDADIDGDAIVNTADTDGDGSGTNTTAFTDTNGDTVIDQFDKDLDGVADFLDLDSDNDGIADVVEFGLTDADEDGTLNEGGGITDLNGNGLNDAQDPDCDGAAAMDAYVVAQTNAGVVDPGNALGNTPLTFANVGPGDNMTLDFGSSLPSGTVITLHLGDDFTTINTTGNITQSNDDIAFSNTQVYTATVQQPTSEPFTYTLVGEARYLNIERTASTISVFYAVYTIPASLCSGGTAVSLSDTDSDGIANHLDLDSDNDGIVDNVEAQLTASYTAPAAGDTDGDGILDVYDEDIMAGNALLPIDTETTGTDDYLSPDSDGDGVLDRIEAFDSNGDGFGSWDSDSDGLLSDEAGAASDTDNDGILLVFDNSSGLGTIANITGTSTDRQDTDGDIVEDWRDVDDDEDGSNTSTTGVSGEDANSNGTWSDDFTQGGGMVPNYLYNPDVDGDGIADVTDLDSDQDGVLNTIEYAGAVYASSGTPFDDNDADGIYNYLDTSDAGNPSFADVNGDGVDDQVDQDRDGIPNFFDLDSDNDGIMDAIEANGGTVPTGFSTTTGRYGVDNSGGDDDDDDNDGLNDNVDVDDGGTALANTDTDNGSIDTLSDFLDLDSDNDGLTDHVEGLTTAAYAAPSGNDTDGDGLDDSFDPDNGGTAISPTNTDGTDSPDYIDTDSDNDTDGIGALLDVIEGYDANKNGFSELDSDLDGLLTDETGHNVDTDGDGLWDLFDSFSGRGTSNTTGTSADLQDTDGDSMLDFRDQDDDGDALTTAVEDVNSNGDWTDDKVQGGGATPDYLFFNDSDGDRVADGEDDDGDNDGLPDTEEYDATTLRDPFGDQDLDGVFNYNDSDDPTNLAAGPLTDSNGDGIWDEYDYDLDGVPDFFDLDTDNDGIQDIIEAGGVDSDNDGKVDGITDTDGDGLFDNVDVDITMGADANFDGIDDSFQDGADADGDGIEDTADLDDDGDGIINVVDTDEGGVALANPDTDGDGVDNVYDLDSDNDGIVDLIEAGGDEADGDGQIDSFGDTDGDGLANAVDPDNGGSAYPFYDSDVDMTLDYLEVDADADAAPDWNEGFDDDEDYDHLDDYESRRAAYELANGSPGHYPTTDIGPANGTPDYLDTGAGGRANFLDPTNGTYYRDTDSDGIVDLFDTDANGVQYGGVSGVPDNNGNLTPNYRENGDEPLPLDWVSFAATYSAGDVDLLWQTVNEINVSHFDIEHSADGETFKIVAKLNAYNTEGFNTYTYDHLNPINGTNFYRLNQVDFDGASDYSRTRVITATVGNISFVIYPNPTEDLLTISADAIITGNARIIDLNGRVVWRSKFSATNKEEIDLSGLSDGVYQLMIETSQGTVIKRIVKK